MLSINQRVEYIDRKITVYCAFSSALLNAAQPQLTIINDNQQFYFTDTDSRCRYEMGQLNIPYLTQVNYSEDTTQRLYLLHFVIMLTEQFSPPPGNFFLMFCNTMSSQENHDVICMIVFYDGLITKLLLPGCAYHITVCTYQKVFIITCYLLLIFYCSVDLE